MAKTDFTGAFFKFTSTSATGAFHDLSQYITEWSGIEITAGTEESHAIGDQWAENAYTGLRTVSPITISGFYDDVAASGPHALMGQTSDVGAERVIKAGFGTTNSYAKQRVIIKRYNRRPVRGELTKYETEFLPAASYAVVAT